MSKYSDTFDQASAEAAAARQKIADAQRLEQERKDKIKAASGAWLQGEIVKRFENARAELAGKVEIDVSPIERIEIGRANVTVTAKFYTVGDQRFQQDITVTVFDAGDVKTYVDGAQTDPNFAGKFGALAPENFDEVILSVLKRLGKLAT